MSLKTRLATALSVAALTMAPTFALAQDRVTVTMRSGEAVTGEFEDLASGVVYVRVSQHDQRRLPFNDIAVIDFAPGSSISDREARAAGSAQHVLVTRDGQMIRGTFQEIAGGPGSRDANRPRTVYFRTESGERRELRPDQVARVYLANAPGASGNTGTDDNRRNRGDNRRGNRWDGQDTTIRVPATSRWTDTGLDVNEGDMVSFTAEGEVRLSRNDADVARPAGSVEGRHADRSPFPSQLAGALIGRVGNGEIFGIGNQTQALRMPASGRLHLGINEDRVGDNSGEFTVRIDSRTNDRDQTRRRNRQQ